MKFNFSSQPGFRWFSLALAGGLLICFARPALCRSLEEVTERAFETGPEPEVSLKTFNGEIEVHAGEEGRVKAVLTKHVYRLTGLGAEQALDAIEIRMSQEGNRIIIEAQGPATRMFFKCTGAILRVEVPSMSKVTGETSNAGIQTWGLKNSQSLRTSDGKVEIDDARGELDISTSNAPLQIELEDGRLRAETSNGSVEIHAARSDVEATTSNARMSIDIDGGTVRGRTSSGRIDVEGRASSVDIESSNGSLDLELGELPVQVHARTSNGGIRFEGNPMKMNLFHTSNGPIRIELPGAGGFWIDASTSNSRITSDFNFDEIVHNDKSGLKARLGENPSTRIILETSNGPIEIERD